MARPQVEDAADRLSGRNSQAPKVAIVRQHESPESHGTPEYDRVNRSREVKILHRQNVNPVIAEKSDNGRMDILVSQEAELNEPQW
jgi:hypothetical protein